MDYKLERKVLFNSKPEHKTLYDWCLNEIDEEGKKIGPDLIPWNWSLSFVASSLHVIRDTSIKIKSEDESGFVSVSSQSTEIRGTFQSGYPADIDRNHDEIYFSMLGTKREIRKFELTIWATKEGHQDLCSVVAIPSYESEISFRRRTEEDHLGFEISLEKKFFDQLVCAIEVGSADTVTLRVGNVRGFYSEWSPSIHADSIKILAPDVTIDGLEAEKFTPPTTSIANDFHLTLRSRRRSGLQTSSSQTQQETDFFEDKSDSLPEGEAPVVSSKDLEVEKKLRNSFDQAVKTMNNLKIPLWAIFAVLVLLLSK